MIVNTVGQDLDLSQGAVSRSLLEAAGPGLQQECRTQVPAGQKLTVGQIIRTSGHQLAQLGCTDVLHGACGKWDDGAGSCETVVSMTMYRSTIYHSDLSDQSALEIGVRIRVRLRVALF